jgi:class 3 adenylate cyclase
VTELPTGTVTFLFTDVEGSTQLLHELGAEGYADALAEHRRILRHVRRRRRDRGRRAGRCPSNLYFGIASTIFVTFVLTFVTAKLVENRLGSWNPADAGEGPQEADDAPEVTPEQEKRGLRFSC